MAFVVGSLVLLLFALVATGAIAALLTWLVLKWNFIAFAILGGIAGGMLQGEKGGVLLGAVAGEAVGIGLLVSLAKSKAK